MLSAVAVAGGSGAPGYPTASVGAAPTVLTSFALVSLDFSGSTDPAGGGLTYSCTLDVKPTSSATTLVDSTTSTPDFTPDKIGTYSGVLTVTDINGRTDTSRWFREVRSALSVSIAAVSNQLDLSAATLDSTVTGGISPYTYAWTVDGATTGLSSSTAADPTFTPTAAGTPTAVVTVTDAAGQTAKASVTWRVGNAAGWVCVWSTSGITDHDFLVTPTKVHNGVTITQGLGGTPPTVHRFASGVLEIDTVTGAGNGAGILFPPVSAVDDVADRDVCITVGLNAAMINADLDGVYVAYIGASGAYCLAEAARVAGAQAINVERSGASATYNISGGAQARVVGIQLSAQRVGFKPLRGTSAWSGIGPEPDSLSVGGGTPSGWHVSSDKAPAATTDGFAPNNNVGASEDRVDVSGRANNGTAYSIPGISYWVRYL